MNEFRTPPRRRELITFLAMIAIAIAFYGGAFLLSSSAEGETHTIIIVERKFSPSELKVSPGDTVQWINQDSVDHQIEISLTTIQSPVLAPGDTWNWTFNNSESFVYYSTTDERDIQGTLIIGEEDEGVPGAGFFLCCGVFLVLAMYLGSRMIRRSLGDAPSPNGEGDDKDNENAQHSDQDVNNEE